VLEPIRNILSRLKLGPRIEADSFKSDVPTITEGFLIGHCTDTGKPVCLDDNVMAQHLFVTGGTGAGKTVIGNNLIEHQIQRGGGLLFIGTADRYGFDEIYSQCVVHGREDDLLVFNPGDPSMSNTYNPLLIGSDQGSPSQIANLVMLALYPDYEGSAVYPRQQVFADIRAIVSAMQAIDMIVNFSELADILRNQKDLEDLKEDVKIIRGIDSDEYKHFALFLDGFSVADELGGERILDIARINTLFGELAARMNSFGSGDLGGLINVAEPEINLIEAIQGGKIIYVMLPPFGQMDFAMGVAKMFLANLSDCITALYELPMEQLPKLPFLCLKDEAFTYSSYLWVDLYRRARGVNIILVSSAHTTLYPQDAPGDIVSKIAGHIGTKIILRMCSVAAAEDIVRLISLHGREGVVTADMILNLALGEAFVMTRLKDGCVSIFKVKIPHAPRIHFATTPKIIHAN